MIKHHGKHPTYYAVARLMKAKPMMILSRRSSTGPYLELFARVAATWLDLATATRSESLDESRTSLWRAKAARAVCYSFSQDMSGSSGLPTRVPRASR
jgi:hypothetical protein